MASLPPRPTRRASPNRSPSSTSANASAQHRKDNGETRSQSSEESQTFLLNGGSRVSTTNDWSNSKSQKSASASPSAANPPAQQVDNEPRKCWICFNDETEDTPTTSEWRAPCTCTLTAHESCLLDWLADMEAPNARRSAGGKAKITCPQCKYELQLSRPRSYVVDTVRLLERLSNKAVLPGVGFALVYTIYQGFFMHGVSSIYTVFGEEDGFRILEPLLENIDPTQPLPFLVALNKAFKHFRLSAGIAMIPPALVLSRTHLGDSILPILPMIFLATSPHSDSPTVIDFGHWPPSAAISFAVLPYIRAAYNASYERWLTPLERKWTKEIQPRNDEQDNGNANRNENARDDNAAANEPGLLDVHFDVDINIWEAEEEEEEQHAGQDAHFNREMPQPRPARPEQVDAAIGAAEANAAADGQAEIVMQPNRPPLHEPRQPNMVLSLWRTSQSFLGALLFPTIAATSGSTLQYILPRSWTTPALGSRRATGLLQSKWGRTLVGGCMFVAVRDLLMLYVRWKMVQNHKQRRVLDHPSKRKSRKFSLGK